MKFVRKLQNIKFCFNVLTFLVLSNFCIKNSVGRRQCKNTYYIYDGAIGYIKTISNVCNCPEDYYIFISTEKKCTNYCKNASSIYIYQYNNNCVDKCPSRTHISHEKEYQCENNLFCENKGLFYNYEQTLCIETIPNGY